VPLLQIEYQNLMKEIVDQTNKAEPIQEIQVHQLMDLSAFEEQIPGFLPKFMIDDITSVTCKIAF
jgi:hypothetical protein